MRGQGAWGEHYQFLRSQLRYKLLSFQFSHDVRSAGLHCTQGKTQPDGDTITVHHYQIRVQALMGQALNLRAGGEWAAAAHRPWRTARPVEATSAPDPDLLL